MYVGLSISRSPSRQKRHLLHLLSRALRGHHLYHSYQKKNVVLRVQPYHTLRAHLVHDSLGLHSSARFGRKINTR